MTSIKHQINARINAAKAKREASGLLVEWSAIPDPRGGTRTFSAYASTESIKQRWIAEGKAKGWVLK